jgi:putative hydrolase of the HAD superfamily
MIAPMARRAILLDALGTLLELQPPLPALQALMRERHGIEVSAQDGQRALRAEMGHYRANCVRAADASSLLELRLECAGIVAAALGGRAQALGAQELLPTLLDSLRFAPFPEVRPTLARWRERGLRLVVASNWDVSLHEVLERTGLRERLDGVATSAQVGAAKPSGELFAAALELAGVAAAEAIHVGDSLEEDVAGARAAGIDAVWLRRERQRDRPAPPGVVVIATLDELEPASA